MAIIITDFPYVMQIIDDVRLIRPYHILIRNCFKYTENQIITDDLKFIYDDSDRKTYASGGTWRNLVASVLSHRWCKSIFETTTNENIPFKCKSSTSKWFLPQKRESVLESLARIVFGCSGMDCGIKVG